jgi:dTDP-4-amino-4,6-dideoxygalactose transaminase
VIPIARPQLGREEEAAVIEVMRSGALAQGEKVNAFEGEFSSRMGARHGVATCNGTAALYLALRAHGISSGDEVITSPLTFIATANAISHAGATPIFADVDESLNLDLDAVAELIGPRTRAIVPVHLHGNPCDLSRFTELAERHGLALVQDACQAVGATVSGQPLGAFGTAVYSLYATKNITTGEGGMIVTNDPQVAQICASLRHQAYSNEPYVHEAIGHNFRMTEMQAAIGLVQLSKLQAVSEQRRENAAYYDDHITCHFRRPRVAPTGRHVYHQYTLRVPDGRRETRDEVRAELERGGVASGVYYPVPLHLQLPYVKLGNPRCRFAEQAAADMFSIPVHPGVSELDRIQVAAALNRIVAPALTPAI